MVLPAMMEQPVFLPERPEDLNRRRSAKLQADRGHLGTGKQSGKSQLDRAAELRGDRLSTDCRFDPLFSPTGDSSPVCRVMLRIVQNDLCFAIRAQAGVQINNNDAFSTAKVPGDNLMQGLIGPGREMTTEK